MLRSLFQREKKEEKQFQPPSSATSNLFVAAHCFDRAGIQEALNQGADINYRPDEKKGVLGIILKNGFSKGAKKTTEILQILIEKKADINIKAEDDTTPLSDILPIPCRDKNESEYQVTLVKYLLNTKATPEIKSAMGIPMLGYAPQVLLPALYVMQQGNYPKIHEMLFNSTYVAQGMLKISGEMDALLPSLPKELHSIILNYAVDNRKEWATKRIEDFKKVIQFQLLYTTSFPDRDALASKLFKCSGFLFFDQIIPFAQSQNKKIIDRTDETLKKMLPL